MRTIIITCILLMFIAGCNVTGEAYKVEANSGAELLKSKGVECDFFETANSSGQQTCESNEYKACIFEEYYKHTVYLNSTSRNCDGEVQVDIITPEMRKCPSGGGGGGGGCTFRDSGVEPYYGDTTSGTYSNRPSRVLCCR